MLVGVKGRASTAAQWKLRAVTRLRLPYQTRPIDIEHEARAAEQQLEHMSGRDRRDSQRVQHQTVPGLPLL